jgi:regulatory protein
MLTEQEILSKIYRYCASQERSPFEIRRKIIKLSGDDSLVKGIEGHLIQEKLMDEFRFATLFVEGKMNSRKWGQIKLADALRKHGISDGVISKVLRSLQTNDYMAMMMRELKKKWQSLKDKELNMKQAKLIRFGLQRGYSYQDIKSCLSQSDFKE